MSKTNSVVRVKALDSSWNVWQELKITWIKYFQLYFLFFHSHYKVHSWDCGTESQ